MIDTTPQFPYTTAALRMALPNPKARVATRRELDAMRRATVSRRLICKDTDATYAFAECLEIVGCGQTWLHRMIDRGDFPAPAFYLSSREGRYAKHEVDAWVVARAEQKQAA